MQPMQPTERKLFDLIRELGTPSPHQLRKHLPQWSIGKLYVILSRLEEQGWLRSQPAEVTDPQRLALRGGRHERVFFIARNPEEQP